jgi:hypothetical protein
MGKSGQNVKLIVKSNDEVLNFISTPPGMVLRRGDSFLFKNIN